MATTVWKGSLVLGTVAVPIKLFAAARSESVSFNQIHAVCGTRIKQQLYCPTCDKVVDRKDLARAQEVSGDLVVVKDDELEAVLPESSKVMAISEFVKLADVDPVYFNASYYVAPEPGNERAYHLLSQALSDSGHSAIARITMHQREHVALLRTLPDGVLIMHTLFHADEVRQPEAPAGLEGVTLSNDEVRLLGDIIKRLTKPFTPEAFVDTYRLAVQKLVHDKAAAAGRALPAGNVSLADKLSQTLHAIPPKKPGRPRKA